MLSDTDKAKIRTWLGHPDGHRYRNTRLESVLDAISPEAEILITEILATLDTIEAQRLPTAIAAAAGVARVDEISFHAPTGNGVSPGWKSLTDAERLWRGRLSVILGVPIAGSGNSFHMA